MGETMTAAPGILVVEDDWLTADYMQSTLEDLGYVVCGIAATADDAVRLAREKGPAAVVMDVRLSGPRDGIEAAIEITRHRPVPIVYVTGDGATRRRVEGQRPAAVLQKPIEREQLSAVLARVCPLSVPGR